MRIDKQRSAVSSPDSNPTCRRHRSRERCSPLRARASKPRAASPARWTRSRRREIARGHRVGGSGLRCAAVNSSCKSAGSVWKGCSLISTLSSEDGAVSSAAADFGAGRMPGKSLCVSGAACRRRSRARCSADLISLSRTGLVKNATIQRHTLCLLCSDVNREEILMRPDGSSARTPTYSQAYSEPDLSSVKRERRGAQARGARALFCLRLATSSSARHRQRSCTYCRRVSPDRR